MTALLTSKYLNAQVKASSAHGPGLLAELLQHPAGRVPSFSATMTELTVVLEGSTAVCRQLDGGRPQRFDAAPGAMWLTPAGACEHFVEFEDAVPQALHIYLTWDRFRSVYPQSWRCRRAIACLRRDAPFNDSLVEAIARAVSADLQSRPEGPPLLTAPLGLCLAARLLHHHSDSQPQAKRAYQPSGLDARRLARVREHVASHLEQDLSVAELAAVACLSPSRFAHGFKTSTGETPQHYVSAQRLERAKRLLSASCLPVAEIAELCGFSSQASFTKAFVRATCQSPGRYRKANGPESAPAAPLAAMEAGQPPRRSGESASWALHP